MVWNVVRKLLVISQFGITKVHVFIYLYIIDEVFHCANPTFRRLFVNKKYNYTQYRFHNSERGFQTVTV